MGKTLPEKRREHPLFLNVGVRNGSSTQPPACGLQPAASRTLNATSGTDPRLSTNLTSLAFQTCPSVSQPSPRCPLHFSTTQRIALPLGHHGIERLTRHPEGSACCTWIFG